MVRMLDYPTPFPIRDIVLCSWTRHSNLAVPLSTQVVRHRDFKTCKYCKYRSVVFKFLFIIPLLLGLSLIYTRPHKLLAFKFIVLK